MTRQFTQKHYRVIAKLLAEQRPMDLEEFEKPTHPDDPNHREDALAFDTQALWPLTTSDPVGYGKLHAWLCIAEDFIVMFKRDSPKFDEGRFKQAIWKTAP